MDLMLIWGLALLAVAFLIAVVEIFLPSAGLLSLLAFTVAAAGVVCLFRKDLGWGLAGSGLVVVGGPAMFFIGLRIMPNTPIGRRMILSSRPQSDEEGELDGDGVADSGGGVGGDVDPALVALIGSEGEVASDLRPVGSVRIGGRRYDALSEAGLLRAGTPVRVTGVEGTELRVRSL